MKAFYINCGSSVFGGDWPDGSQVSIRMGVFDEDPGIQPQFHTFVGDRAPWERSLITLRNIVKAGRELMCGSKYSVFIRG